MIMSIIGKGKSKLRMSVGELTVSVRVVHADVRTCHEYVVNVDVQ